MQMKLNGEHAVSCIHSGMDENENDKILKD